MRPSRRRNFFRATLFLSPILIVVLVRLSWGYLATQRLHRALARLDDPSIPALGKFNIDDNPLYRYLQACPLASEDWQNLMAARSDDSPERKAALTELCTRHPSLPSSLDALPAPPALLAPPSNYDETYQMGAFGYFPGYLITFLCHDAVLASKRGDEATAFRHFRRAIRLSRYLDAYPTDSAHKDALYIQSPIAHTIEFLEPTLTLSTPAARDEAHRLMAILLDDQPDSLIFENIMRAALASLRLNIPLRLKGYDEVSSERWFYRWDRPDYLTYLAKTIEEYFEDLSLHRRYAPADLFQRQQNERLAGHLRHVASRRIAATFLALRLFASDHGRLPPTLDPLVPNYLPQLPADPFSPHTPLRYRIDPMGPTLWSVGPDGHDNAAALDPTRHYSRSGHPDLVYGAVWRTFRPSHYNSAFPPFAPAYF